jgi:hypothetical protein
MGSTGWPAPLVTKQNEGLDLTLAEAHGSKLRKLDGDELSSLSNEYFALCEVVA